jgi:signal transduction histidine kinase
MRLTRSPGDPERPRRWDPGAREEPEVPESGWDELERLKQRALKLGLEAGLVERPPRGPGSKREERAERRDRARPRRERFLSPEERALHEATRRAERKVKFVQHVISYVCVVGFLFVAINWRLGLIVAFGWGIGLASHFFQAMLAPGMRRRWISSEVDRQVQKTVTRERRTLEEEKLRSLEELSASIAHEIRNPITAAKSLVQQMGEDLSAPDNVEYAKVALEELDRVERSISHLLRYAREEEMQVRTMRLGEVVEGALESFRDRLERSGIALEHEIASEGEMEGDPEKLRRVVINLVGNALDALEEGGVRDARIDVAVGENLAGNEVWLRVRDNGPGLDEETQRKMFRPFFTSKANGTGLGLAITRKLVDAHGGQIEVRSAPGEGAEFTVVFPRNGREVPTPR